MTALTPSRYALPLPNSSAPESSPPLRATRTARAVFARESIMYSGVSRRRTIVKVPLFHLLFSCSTQPRSRGGADLASSSSRRVAQVPFAHPQPNSANSITVFPNSTTTPDLHTSRTTETST